MTLVSKIPRIVLVSQVAITAAVRKAELDIERKAKSKSRVDTGTMRAGWQHQPQGAYEGIVFNLTEYTIYNEYGTTVMSAQPMLRPAVEEVRPDFERDVREAYLT